MADLIASMPLIELAGGAYVQFEAVDPITGANVAGVVAQAGTFTAVDIGGVGAADGTPPAPLLVYGDPP